MFNKPDSQSQELTRQRIVQEERCGRRPATTIPGPSYDQLVRGKGEPMLLADPWAPPKTRQTIQPPLVGYGGTIPLVRPEHTGVNNGEQAAHFVPHFGSRAYAKCRREAPAGGASALGTKPFAVPGTRSKCRTNRRRRRVARPLLPFISARARSHAACGHVHVHVHVPMCMGRHA